MRRLILASTLFLAACATRPQQPVEETPPPEPSQPQAHQIVGLTTGQLIGLLGTPALQIREGNSLKLQFRGSRCVLDAYLYPQGGGMRVTYVDARTPAGTDVDRASCVSSLANRS